MNEKMLEKKPFLFGEAVPGPYQSSSRPSQGTHKGQEDHIVGVSLSPPPTPSWQRPPNETAKGDIVLSVRG